MIHNSLRGGGCAAGKPPSSNQALVQAPDMPVGLLTSLDNSCKTIYKYRDKPIDHEVEIISSFQYFEVHEQDLYRMSNDAQWASSSFKTALDRSNELVEAISSYCKTKFEYAYMSAALLYKLGRILFKFYTFNQHRYQDVNEQQAMLKSLDAAQEQANIERSEHMMKNLFDFELLRVRSIFSIAPTNSTEGKDILQSFLSGAISSALTWKLNDELLNSITHGMVYLYSEYKKLQLKRKLEMYYYMDFLFINILQDPKLDIRVLSKVYVELIENSKEWELLMAWNEMIFKLIKYRLIIQDCNGYQELVKNNILIKVEGNGILNVSYNKINDAMLEQLKIKDEYERVSEMQLALIGGSNGLPSMLKSYQKAFNLEHISTKQNITQSQVDLLSRLKQGVEQVVKLLNRLSSEQSKQAAQLDTLAQCLQECIDGFTIYCVWEIEQADIVVGNIKEEIVQHHSDLWKSGSKKQKEEYEGSPMMPLKYWDDDIEQVIPEQTHQQIIQLCLKWRQRLMKNLQMLQHLQLLQTIKKQNDNVAQLQKYLKETSYEEVLKCVSLSLSALKNSKNKQQNIRISISSQFIQQLEIALTVQCQSVNHYLEVIKEDIQSQVVDVPLQITGITKISEQIKILSTTLVQIVEVIDRVKLQAQYEFDHKQSTSVTEIPNKVIEYYTKRLNQQIPSIIKNAEYDTITTQLSKQEDDTLLITILHYHNIVGKLNITGHAEQELLNDIIKLILEAAQQAVTNQVNNVINDEQNNVAFKNDITKLDEFNILINDANKELQNFQVSIDGLQQMLNNIKIMQQNQLIVMAPDGQQNEKVKLFADETEGRITKQSKDYINEINQLQFTLKHSQLLAFIRNHKFAKYSTDINGVILTLLTEIAKPFTTTVSVDSLKTKLMHQLNMNSWRIRQMLVIRILQTQTQCLTESAQQLSGALTVQVKVLENDPKIKAIFNDPQYATQLGNLILQNWDKEEENINALVKQEIQEMNEILAQVEQAADITERNSLMQQYQRLQSLVNDQVSNLKSVGQAFGVNILFLNDIKQDIRRVASRLKKIEQQLESIAQDVRLLRGRTVNELLQIRMARAQAKEYSVYVPFRVEDTELFGVINTLIWERQDSLLISGAAGAGKTTAARMIETHMWRLFGQREVIPVVPILISIPSVHDPLTQLVEDTLESEAYRFDKKQIIQLRELVEQQQLRIVFIIDSYDELKPEHSGQNLSLTNKLSKWRHPSDIHKYPKVITTSRSDALNARHYKNWFISSKVEYFKEVRLLRLNQQQIDDYIFQYSKLQLQKVIGDYFNENDRNKDIITSLWKDVISKWEFNNINTLCTPEQVKDIFGMLNLDDKQLTITIQELWSAKKYHSLLHQMNLLNIIETPFMLEIVLTVLPKMHSKRISPKYIEQQFLRECNLANSHAIWTQIQQSQQFWDGYQQQLGQLQIKQLLRITLPQLNDLEKISQALTSEPLTSFSFYQEFLTQYFDKELFKNRKAGIKVGSCEKELWQFAQGLANEMTFHKMFQVQYQPSGLIFKNKETDWRDTYFDDDQNEYRKIFRSCIPSSGTINTFQFQHKSTQEYLVALSVVEVLVQPNSDLINHKLSTVNFADAYMLGVVKFIGEQLRYNRTVQKRMLQLVSCSADTKNGTSIKLASNMLYMLCRMGYQFDSLKLPGIQISDISLRGGCFFNTDLSGSTFLNVNISNCNFSRAILNNVKWSGIRVNELPDLYSEHKVVFMEFQQGKLLSCDQEGCIKQFEVANGNCTSNVVACKRVTKVALSHDGNKMALLDADQQQLIQYSLKDRHIDSTVNAQDIINVAYSGNKLIVATKSNVTIDSRLICEQRVKSLFATVNVVVMHVQTCNFMVYQNNQLSEHKSNHKQIWSMCVFEQLLAIGGGESDRTIELWGLDKLEILYNVDGLDISNVRCLSFRDRNTLVSISNGVQIRVWDLDMKQQINQIESPNSLEYLAVSNSIIATSEQQLIQLWDIDSWEREDRVVYQQISCVSLNDECTFIGIGCQSQVIIWDLLANKSHIQIPFNNQIVQAIAMDDPIVHYSLKNMLYIHDYRNGISVQELQVCHIDLYILWMQFQQESKLLIIKVIDGSVRLINKDYTTFRVLQDQYQQIEYTLVDSIHNYKVTDFSQIKLNEQQYLVQQLDGIHGNIISIYVTHIGNSDKLFIMTDSYEILSIKDNKVDDIAIPILQGDIKWGRILSPFKFAYVMNTELIVFYKQEQWVKQSVQLENVPQYCNSSDTFLMCCCPNAIFLLNYLDNKEYKLDTNNMIITAITYMSPDIIYGGSNNGIIIQWQLNQAQPTTSFEAHKDAILQLITHKKSLISLSNTLISYWSDNKIKYKVDIQMHYQMYIPISNPLILFTYDSKFVYLWDIDNGDIINKLELDIEPQNIVYSDNQLYIGDNTILYNIPISWNQQLAYSKRNQINCVSSLYTGAQDGTIKLWNSEFTKNAVSIKGDKSAVIALYSIKNKILAGYVDGTIKLYSQSKIEWQYNYQQQQQQPANLLNVYMFNENSIVYALDSGKHKIVMMLINTNEATRYQDCKQVYNLLGMITGRDVFVTFGQDSSIRIYKQQGYKVILPSNPYINCDHTQISNANIKTYNNMNLVSLFQQRGAI